MKTTKRRRLKNFGLLVSSVVSLSAPYDGIKPFKPVKTGKNCKKSRADSLESSSDASDGQAGPPPDEPPAAQAPLPDLRLSGMITASPPGTPVLAVVEVPNLVGSQPVNRFPWRSQIATTVFWIGEKSTETNPTPNHQSSWDEKWARNYGGFDDPDPKSRRGFIPADFTPNQNPFYVALPYNDLCAQGHKGEARKMIPWFKSAYQQRNKSVCKGRWIAIRKDNRVCYAQWEDAGPFCTDDAAYVFGTARPKNAGNHGAGLDVSPAVRDYLGLGGSDVTDWRFADIEEVPYGPWAEYGSNNTWAETRSVLNRPVVAAAGASAWSTVALPNSSL